MSRSLIEYAFQLTQMGKPFALATVVRCERPTSAKPGAQAIIQDDGQMVGWIGGSCAQPVVVREATRLLREGGEPLLLRLKTDQHGERDEQDAAEEMASRSSHFAPGSPEGEDSSGMRVFPMACVSGGALDIYIEPHLPQPQLLLIGESPIIGALMQLAQVLDFTVTRLTYADLGQIQLHKRTYILIATHGQYDEDVLEQVLRGPAAYIGMVSSPRRAETCRNYLRTSGMEEQYIARLKAPAGLDIGAVTPEEIAASILAELVQVKRRATNQSALDVVATPPSPQTNGDREDPVHVEEQQDAQATAIDPICGMTVEIAQARHRSTYEGHEFYFCCPACKRQFERDPQRALLANER